MNPLTTALLLSTRIAEMLTGKSVTTACYYVPPTHLEGHYDSNRPIVPGLTIKSYTCIDQATRFRCCALESTLAPCEGGTLVSIDLLLSLQILHTRELLELGQCYGSPQENKILSNLSSLIGIEMLKRRVMVFRRPTAQ